MKIMALDLGHNNCRTAVCLFDTDQAQHETRWVKTEPVALARLVDKVRPDRIVMEACPVANWVYDLLVSLEIGEVQVAATNGEAWCWRNNKKKTDKMDALKLARLAVVGQISAVHMPTRAVRQWRSLIRKRTYLINKRTSIKNSIHGILTREGVVLENTGGRWSKTYMEALEKLAVPLQDTVPEQIWRGLLWVELEALESIGKLIKAVEARLDAIAAQDPRVQMIKNSEKGVGIRFAESLVAKIDDPLRFPNAKHLGSYFGLVPRQYQSGKTQREGRVHKQGDQLMRTLAVEVAWIAIRHNPWARDVYHRVRKNTDNRGKKAAVALARRILVKCWARLRDYELQKQAKVTA